jgi:hypothetical protein
MSAESPSTVPDVVARLRAIEASCSKGDGVGCFARLYREVTQEADALLGQQRFADARYMQGLDVRFAGLFFSAFDAYARDPATAPSAWRPLFEQRSRRGIAPLQFALAGMNAHINRDLPIALVETSKALQLDLHEQSPEHDDFERVNSLLAQVEARIKSVYVTGWLARLDRFIHPFHRIDDVVAMWDVARARDAAWSNGQALWALRADASLSAEFVQTLDRMVGMASRGLLIPADTVLRKVWRLLT